jgi:hypothetical protein
MFTEQHIITLLLLLLCDEPEWCSRYGDWLRVERRSGRGSSPGMINFLFSMSSRPALGPIQYPIQWVLGARSPGGKAAGA